MRVLEVITPSKIGGAEVYVADLCTRLPELGLDVELFVPSDRPFVNYAAQRGIPSINWKTHGKFDPITVVRLARLIRSHKIDVVHTHLSTASLLGAWAARLTKKPSIAHVHGLNTATCFRYSTAVIAVSGAVKRHLCAQGIDETRVYVVHNGVDLDRFKPIPIADAKRTQGYDPSQPLFGVFGRLSSEKGQRTAVEAMFLLSKTCPTARLILAGDGRDREELAQSAEALGIADNVEFRGFVEDIRGPMPACDAVIIPSLKEGFGLAAVEAMALSRPVIATKIGGLPEIVVDGETGFLVAPNEPNGIVEAMETLVSDKALAERMGTLGRERVEKHFNQTKQFAEVMDVLRSMTHK